MDINTVTIIGRLTKDPESKQSQSGSAVAPFSIAVGRKVKKGDSWEDETSFFDCTAFGKTAELLVQYCKKGKQIGVTGHLVQDRWTDKEGKNRSRVTIIVDQIQFLGGEKKEMTETVAPQNVEDPNDIPF